MRFVQSLAAAALVAVALVASPAIAQNVIITLEPLSVTPPTVPSGEVPFLYWNGTLYFPIGKNDVASVVYGVYVEVVGVQLGVLQLSYEWDADGTLLFLLGGVPESNILFGPQGFMDRQSNVFLDPDNFVSPVVRGIDYGLEPFLFPASDGKDLAGLIVFQVDLSPDGYTQDATSLFIRAGVLDAMNDVILDTSATAPDFNGMPIAPGQNLSEAEIVVTKAPEPGTSVLLLSGVGSLIVLARRRGRGGAASDDVRG